MYTKYCKKWDLVKYKTISIKNHHASRLSIIWKTSKRELLFMESMHAMFLINMITWYLNNTVKVNIITICYNDCIKIKIYLYFSQNFCLNLIWKDDELHSYILYSGCMSSQKNFFSLDMQIDTYPSWQPKPNT